MPKIRKVPAAKEDATKEQDTKSLLEKQKIAQAMATINALVNSLQAGLLEEDGPKDERDSLPDMRRMAG